MRLVAAIRLHLKVRQARMLLENARTFSALARDCREDAERLMTEIEALARHRQASRPYA